MEKVQKKMGRPPIKNARTDKITVRVTPQEKAKIIKLAEKKGLTISELVLSKLKIK